MLSLSFLLQHLHSQSSGDTLQPGLSDLTVEDHAVEHMRQGRVSWLMSATTNWTEKPSWYLASTPLPLSYSALCYMVHLLLVAFPTDVLALLSKLPVQALSSATWTMLCWPFPLPAAAASSPRSVLFHVRCSHWFHSLRSPPHSIPSLEPTPFHRLSLWTSLPARSQSPDSFQRIADLLLT